MIDVSWGHLVVIAVVALIVIGPKELPTVLRTVGHWTGKIRRMAAEFQGQFQEALREAEVADLKQHFDDISSAAKDLPRFDPVSTIRKEIEEAAADKPSDKPSPGDKAGTGEPGASVAPAGVSSPTVPATPASLESSPPAQISERSEVSSSPPPQADASPAQAPQGRLE